MRPYELMYLIQPTADEERLTAVSDRLQQSIGSLGGKVDKVTPPITTPLVPPTALQPSKDPKGPKDKKR